MKKVFGTIRKWNMKGNGRNPATKTNLHKQITTFYKKLKKIDNTAKLIYSIERDQFRYKYHVQVQIWYTDEESLYNLLGMFVHGDWTKGIGNGGAHDTCYGKYGTVYLESLRDVKASYDYQNKFINSDSKSLV